MSLLHSLTFSWTADTQVTDKILRAHFVLCYRPARGDDSDDEDGASRPKKQRKPKERKKIEKVLSVLLCCD